MAQGDSGLSSRPRGSPKETASYTNTWTLQMLGLGRRGAAQLPELRRGAA